MSQCVLYIHVNNNVLCVILLHLYSDERKKEKNERQSIIEVEVRNILYLGYYDKT
jgi:hypothetical protein